MSVNITKAEIMQIAKDSGGSAASSAKVQDNKEDKSLFETINEFDDWSNSKETPEDFKMFDIDLSRYTKDVKEFAQAYVEKYDVDEDGSWNFSEFLNMSTNGTLTPELLAFANDLYKSSKREYEDKIIPQNDANGNGGMDVDEFATALGYDYFNMDIKTKGQVLDLFEGLNTKKEDNTKKPEVLDADELLVGLNPEIEGISSNALQYYSQQYDLQTTLYSDLDYNGDDKINVGEYASQLMMGDIDWKNATDESNLGDLLDGKLNFDSYQTYASIPWAEGNAANVAYRKAAYEHYFN